MSELAECYKTCGRCVHRYKGDQNISGSTCYLCKRNPDDHRIDWFEWDRGENVEPEEEDSEIYEAELQENTIQRSNMGNNFTKRSMRVTTDALRVFASNHNLIMGIDVHSDNRPNIIKYVFYHVVSGKGVLIIVDFMQVEHLDKSIDVIIERLIDKFNLDNWDRYLS